MLLFCITGGPRDYTFQQQQQQQPGQQPEMRVRVLAAITGGWSLPSLLSLWPNRSPTIHASQSIRGPLGRVDQMHWHLILLLGCELLRCVGWWVGVGSGG